MSFILQHDSGICLDSGMCFTPFESMENTSMGMMNSVPVSLAHSSPNSEGNAPPVMDIHFVTHGDEKENSSSKQHIAYHLLSNLLDDEISEDSKHTVQDVPTSLGEANDV